MGLEIASSALRIEVDETTGHIVGVWNLARDIGLMARSPDGPPFRLTTAELGDAIAITGFSAERTADGLDLRWTTDRSVVVRSRVAVRGDAITLHVVVEDPGQLTVDRIEYPILDGIGRLAGRGRDTLVHSHATGMLFHDPVDLLDADPDNHRRLRWSPYPTGFAGSTLQCLGYIGAGQGGFLVTTEDPDGQLKWFSVHGDGTALTMSVTHKVPIETPGAAFDPGYPVVLGALLEGTWTEVGDRYRAWMLRQPWAVPASPPTAWLREAVGISTFGINARHDRSAWLDAIHAMAGTPVFHVLGPNWAQAGQDYQGHLPGRMEDWFPAVFDPANLATIERNGDRWAPFEFDLLASDPEDRRGAVAAARMAHHDGDLGRSDAGILRMPVMCPATTYWHDFHVERDARLIREHGPDALYYDISVNNMLPQCLATGHGHPPAAGAPIGDAYARMYRDTSAAMDAAAERHVPVGAEVISERYAAAFDFFQGRAWSGPYAPFEAHPFRDWVVDGRAETIPLLTYVLGERAPLRLDGWAKLSVESGDLFYWVAANVVLDGGLLELNYEFSGLEDLDDRQDDPSEHYYPFESRRYGIDPDKASFVGMVARARTGPAGPFLARGRLRPTPVVEAPPVTLAYHAYNAGSGHDGRLDDGAMTVPSARAAAWELDGRTMWLVANLLPASQEVLVEGRPLSLDARSIVAVEA